MEHVNRGRTNRLLSLDAPAEKTVKRGELNTLRMPRISLPESPKGIVLNSIDTLPIFATELVNYKSDACFVDMEDKTCAFP